ncbi:hypothetical protein [Lysobacter antibioticus]|uniref:Uncharacterized protein n=1 Tax=Lysobacter antibioticus TaxID=84531 RepID=A0A0S2FHT9_LYSAN|nr:hypothetical protein [Lysobacter antibioticus]ALN83129.1 hypothetical protein LA76x_5027 [Lysobacter antibioticus]
MKEIEKQEALLRLSRFNRVFQDIAAFVVCLGAVTLYACLGLVITGWVEKEALRTFVLSVFVIMLLAFVSWSITSAAEGIWKGWKITRRFSAVQADQIDRDEAAALQFRAYISSATAEDVEERKARIEQHLKEAKARGAFAGTITALLTGLGSLKSFLSTPSADNPFDFALMGAALGLGVSVGLAFWLYAEEGFGRLAFELERTAVAKRLRSPAVAAPAPALQTIRASVAQSPKRAAKKRPGR